MRFRVLGPLEVVGAAGPVQVAAPRHQVVLSTLLLEPNRPVPVDRLVDALWEENPPLTAKGQIQICVSALRRQLADAGLPGVVVTRPPGYLFQCEDDHLDLQIFERLAAEGHRAAADGQLPQAASALSEALRLWRGQPLAGVRSRLVQRVATRLSQRRLDVVEEYVDVELQLGRERDLVGELHELVEANPLRERLRGQLMVALYRLGRQAEALEVYRDARQIFVDELGLEPGADLRRLEQAILTGSTTLSRPGAPRLGGPTPASASASPQAAARPVPRLLPADVADFTGHGHHVARLRELLGAARGPRPPEAAAAVVTGALGVGKTALAVHVAHALRDEFPDGQIFIGLAGSTGEPVSAAQALQRLLRALGLHPEAILDSVEERAEAYRNAVADRRLLVVLDDALNERQVLPLLPGSPSCAVVVTSRFRLTAVPGARQVVVNALPVPDGVELLADIIGPDRVRAEPEDAERLVRLCDGLPLSVRIAAARLAARPHWSISRLAERMEDETGRLDELAHGGLDVRARIVPTYQSLTPPAGRLLRLLSMFGPTEFAGWVCGPLLGTDPVLAEEVLAELVHTHHVAVHRPSGGPARFHVHGLVRSYALERLDADEAPADRIAALSRVLRTWLSRAEGSGFPADAAGEAVGDCGGPPGGSDGGPDGPGWREQDLLDTVLRLVIDVLHDRPRAVPEPAAVPRAVPAGRAWRPGD